MTTTASKSAIADAIAGVIGSLVSTITFYPIDVYKTNLQASSTTTVISSSKQEQRRKQIRTYLRTLFRGLHWKATHTTLSSFVYFFLYSFLQNRHRSYVMMNRRIKADVGSKKKEYNPNTVTRLLLAGIAAMLNTIVTLPLDVISARSQTKKSSLSVRNQGKEKGQLHGDECRRKEGHEKKKDEERLRSRRIMDEAWEDIGKDEDMSHHSYGTAEEQHSYEGSDDDENEDSNHGDEAEEEEKKDDAVLLLPPVSAAVVDRSGGRRATTSMDAADLPTKPKQNGMDTAVVVGTGSVATENTSQCSTTNVPSSSLHPVILRGQSQQPPSSAPNNNTFTQLWKGLLPSLLLCTNPSIHYTVFDTLKSQLLQQKQRQQRTTEAAAGNSILNKTHQEQQGTRLTMMEAFLLGLVAKFVATIVTYPLIRAKVLLMVSSSTSSSSGSSQQQNVSRRDGDNTKDTTSPKKQQQPTTTTTRKKRQVQHPHH